MPGRRLEADSIGESYEVFAETVLSRIATLTRIGPKRDFGTDTLLPTARSGRRADGDRHRALSTPSKG
jgi:hypothetical protein